MIGTHTQIHALKLTYVYGYYYAYMHSYMRYS
jgi:hypothetical protein